MHIYDLPSMQFQDLVLIQVHPVNNSIAPHLLNTIYKSQNRIFYRVRKYHFETPHNHLHKPTKAKKKPPLRMALT